MKIVKLILIFAILAAGIAAALLWDSIFTPTPKGLTDDRENSIVVDRERKQIVEKWDARDTWSRDLHQSISDHISQLQKSGNVSNEGYITLRNSLVENSLNKARESYLRELRSDEHSSKNLNDFYNGVVFIRDSERIQNDPRITEVIERQRLFNNIMGFVNSSHQITPKFDTERLTWKDFKSQQDRILNEAASYRQNQYYADLKNWPGIESGLNAASLKSITDNQKASFYAGLSQQIIDFFSSTEPNQEDYRHLTEVYNKFAKENGTVSKLAAYRTRYNNALKSE